MKITGRVWMELTKEERIICLEFAAVENFKRMKKAA